MPINNFKIVFKKKKKKKLKGGELEEDCKPTTYL